MNSADVMTPSVPSFCRPGRPPSALLVMSFHRPLFRISLPRSSIARSRCARRVADLEIGPRRRGRILRSGWFTRCTVQSNPPGMAMRYDEQVVDGRSPQHRGLAAGVLGDVAADGRGPGAGRVGGEDQTVAGRPVPWPSSVITPASRSITRPSSVRPSSRTNGRVEMPRMRFSFSVFTITQSGVSGTAPPVRPVPAAARDGVQPKGADGGEQRSHLRLVGGGDHRQRQVEPPVGGVGGVGHQREGVEQHVLSPHHRPEGAAKPGVEVGRAPHLLANAVEHAPRLGQYLQDIRVAAGTFLDEAEVGLCVAEEPFAPAGRRDEFLSQVGVAAVNQHLAEDAHEQSR